MNKPQKSSRAPPQPRKLPGRAPKASKWSQKAKDQKMRKQKNLTKSLLTPSQTQTEPKKAEIDFKKQKNQKSKKQKNEKWKLSVYISKP